MRAEYERVTSLDEALGRVRELAVRTVVFDVEPLVTYWDNGQDALDQGVALVVRRITAVASVRVLCFATNSARRPLGTPGSAGMRVVFLTSAGKPLRIAPYREFPQPGLLIGDQMATDGILAQRLGYTFVMYRPPMDGAPAGPRLMGWLGLLIRPLLFRPI